MVDIQADTKSEMFNEIIGRATLPSLAPADKPYNSVQNIYAALLDYQPPSIKIVTAIIVLHRT